MRRYEDIDFVEFFSAYICVPVSSIKMQVVFFQGGRRIVFFKFCEKKLFLNLW